MLLSTLFDQYSQEEFIVSSVTDLDDFVEQEGEVSRSGADIFPFVA